MNMPKQSVESVKTESLESLQSFPEGERQCLILERAVPQLSDDFFAELLNNSISLSGPVQQNQVLSDVKVLVEQIVPEAMNDDAVYSLWLHDMAEICAAFAQMVDQDKIQFTLSSQRGCRRFHVDNVAFRLVVTYAGKGTEWLADAGADRAAFLDGAPNEKIVKDKSAINFMNTGDIAVFRGGPGGLLHRTPDAALNSPSIFMRLDVM